MSETLEPTKRFLVVVQFFQGGQKVFETDEFPIMLSPVGSLRITLSESESVTYAPGRWSSYIVKDREGGDHH